MIQIYGVSHDNCTRLAPMLGTWLVAPKKCLAGGDHLSCLCTFCHVSRQVSRWLEDEALSCHFGSRAALTSQWYSAVPWFQIYQNRAWTLQHAQEPLIGFPGWDNEYIYVPNCWLTIQMPTKSSSSVSAQGRAGDSVLFSHLGMVCGW